MSCLQYSGPITIPSQHPLTLSEYRLQVYDVLVSTCNEVFPHDVPVALFAPVEEEEHVLCGSYFIFARVFVNDFDIGEYTEPPQLIFWMKCVSCLPLPTGPRQQLIAVIIG